MCNYCGCRQFPLIARFTAEHEVISNAAGALREAVEQRRPDVPALLRALVGLVTPHTAAEESGLFRELLAEGSLAEAVERLCAEHTHIHGVLATVDPDAPDPATVLAALDRLREHIDHEEHGLFPAAVIALPFDAWDRVSP
ncbi:hemerythrin domain-containing protein [Pilimelia columellifera]|uniref:Hemerythrin-like domain-containing protein n=1 Tax=Pilimelia columellifera subsp. columellifera TaxID=706583 RepID=A0ABP6AW89_9ACTN